MTEQTMDELRKLSEPLIKYLKEHYHPYVKIEISNSAISVFEETMHLPIEREKGDAMAKGKYEKRLESDSLLLLEAWSRDGLTDEQIAKNMGIGDRIKKLRETKGLTQLELSKEISVKRETINQWENSTRDLKTAAIIDLAKYFNVSADYLLGLSDVPHKSYDELANDYSKLLATIKQFKERFSDLNDYVNKEL